MKTAMRINTQEDLDLWWEMHLKKCKQELEELDKIIEQTNKYHRSELHAKRRKKEKEMDQKHYEIMKEWIKNDL